MRPQEWKVGGSINGIPLVLKGEWSFHSHGVSIIRASNLSSTPLG